MSGPSRRNVAGLMGVVGEWERLQRVGRDLLGVMPLLVGPDGDLLAGETQLSGFCRLIRSTVLGISRCRECYARECFSDTVAAEGVGLWRCHGGLLVCAVPLVAAGVPVAAVVGGGIGSADTDTTALRKVTMELGLSAEEVLAEVAHLPVLKEEELLVAGRAIRSVASDLVGIVERYRGLETRSVALASLLEERAGWAVEEAAPGVLTKEALEVRLQEEILRARRRDGVVCVVCVGLTGWEALRGERGATAAEVLVQEVVRLVHAGARTGESVGRFEEHMLFLILPGVEYREGMRAAERIVGRVAETLSVTRVADRLRAQAGVAVMPARQAEVDELLRRAQSAYEDLAREGTEKVALYVLRPRAEAAPKRRVVVTGIGMVTPLGIGTEVFWEAAKRGESGIRPFTLFDATGLPTRFGGEVPGFDPHDFLDAKTVKRAGRSTHLAVAASRLAVDGAGLDMSQEDAERVGVYIGTGVGGIEFAEEQHKIFLGEGSEKVSPFLAIVVFSGAVSSEVSMQLGSKGPTVTISTGCAAGADAIGWGFRAIQSGEIDAALAGGAEAPLRPIIVASFNAIRALSTRNDAPAQACRPFDRDRDGFVMSEGAAVLVLEELGHAITRGATILGEVLGYSATGDAFHMVRPAPDGAEAGRAMTEALADARLTAQEVEYVNAHGSSTPLNDKTETMIIKSVLGEHAYRVPVNSTKGLIGHSIGASGPIELAACLLSIRDRFVHPTINYEHPDPECDLDYVPNVGREMSVRNALCNSFGFGGKNATLVVGAFED